SEMMAEQYAQVHGMRKLRGPTEPAVYRVEASHECSRGLVEQLEFERRCALFRRAEGTEMLGHGVGRLSNLLVAFYPGPMHAFQYAREAGHAARVSRRKVRPAEKRLALRGQEHGHGPATVSRHRHDGRHVDLIKVGSFLAINFDVDEVLVHERSDFRVLEA